MKLHLLIGIFALLFVCAAGAYVVFGPAQQPGTAETKYPGDPIQGQPVKTASGLVYYDLKEGTGPTPDGSTTRVKVHYTGWLLNGSKFDSSVDKGAPYTTALTDVIAGWTEGVGSMKVGGKRKLIVPPELGYKWQARQNIPAGSTLVFDVELLGIE